MPASSSGRPTRAARSSACVGEQPGHLAADDAAAEHGDLQRVPVVHAASLSDAAGAALAADRDPVESRSADDVDVEAAGAARLHRRRARTAGRSRAPGPPAMPPRSCTDRSGQPKLASSDRTATLASLVVAGDEDVRRSPGSSVGPTMMSQFIVLSALTTRRSGCARCRALGEAVVEHRVQRGQRPVGTIGVGHVDAAPCRPGRLRHRRPQGIQRVHPAVALTITLAVRGGVGERARPAPSRRATRPTRPPSRWSPTATPITTSWPSSTSRRADRLTDHPGPQHTDPALPVCIGQSPPGRSGAGGRAGRGRAGRRAVSRRSSTRLPASVTATTGGRGTWLYVEAIDRQ